MEEERYLSWLAWLGVSPEVAADFMDVALYLSESQVDFDAEPEKWLEYVAAGRRWRETYGPL
jgi:hypothetical protein